jgi:hypothetical protein
VQAMLFVYIETFYNPKRLHSALGYLFTTRVRRSLASRTKSPKLTNSRVRVFEDRSLTSMLNLARMLKERDLAGDRKLEEQVLEARARLLGMEHPDTLGLAEKGCYAASIALRGGRCRETWRG